MGLSIQHPLSSESAETNYELMLIVDASVSGTTSKGGDVILVDPTVALLGREALEMSTRSETHEYSNQHNWQWQKSKCLSAGKGMNGAFIISSFHGSENE